MSRFVKLGGKKFKIKVIDLSPEKYFDYPDEVISIQYILSYF